MIIKDDSEMGYYELREKGLRILDPEINKKDYDIYSKVLSQYRKLFGERIVDDKMFEKFKYQIEHMKANIVPIELEKINLYNITKLYNCSLRLFNIYKDEKHKFMSTLAYGDENYIKSEYVSKLIIYLSYFPSTVEILIAQLLASDKDMQKYMLTKFEWLNFAKKYKHIILG